MLLLVLVIFNYGFYLFEFCNCFFLVCVTFLFPQQIMIMGYSLLFRFGVISLFQQSLVELLYHLLMDLLYPDSISISLFSDFSSPFVHFHNYIEYTISFNNFIFEFIPLGLLYKTFSLFFVIFLFIDRSYSFCSFLSVGSTPL